MNFGPAFIIRFKAIIVTLVISCSVSAGNIVTDKALALENAKLAYVKLNNRVDICLGKKDREIDITDSWLLKQPIEKQKAIAFVLLKYAEDKCAQNEENAYIKAIFDLAVLGDRKALDEYIELSQYGNLDDNIRGLLDGVSKKEIEKLSVMDKYSTPFDIISAFN
jgi:hypothetical protein